MKYQQAVEKYLTELQQRGYSKRQIQHKGGLLRKWLSYALSLFHPDILKDLVKLDQPIFYSRERIFTEVPDVKRKAVGHFLQVWKAERERVSYLNLGLFLKNYRKQFLETDAGRKQKEDALVSFFRAVGFSIRIQTITKKIYQNSLDYLTSLPVKRARGCSQAFFIFCHEKGWIGFDPYEERRSPYQKIFETDFIGESGIWANRLKEYISYLKFERNLSDGGIDYQIRKLKAFTCWLDSQGCKEPDLVALKAFMSMKKEEGVKDNTIAKYIFTIRYFFQFLVEKGNMKKNPALELRIKGRTYSQGEVLEEVEVNQVLEKLENEIYQTKGTKDIQKMMQHFTAVRDLCLFHFFTFTGVRLSEVFGMELKDIDFENKSIRITAKGNREYRQKSREVLLDDYIWATLARYLKVRNHPGQECLWLSFKGSPLSFTGINRVIKFRVRQTGIDKKISPHRLRATCASLYVKKGMDPFSLKTLLGHHSMATTMDHYAQLTEEELREVWKKTNPLKDMDDE